MFTTILGRHPENGRCIPKINLPQIHHHHDLLIALIYHHPRLSDHRDPSFEFHDLNTVDTLYGIPLTPDNGYRDPHLIQAMVNYAARNPFDPLNDTSLCFRYEGLTEWMLIHLSPLFFYPKFKLAMWLS